MRKNERERGRLGCKEGEWEGRRESGKEVRRQREMEGGRIKWEGEWEERGRIGWKEGEWGGRTDKDIYLHNVITESGAEKHNHFSASVAERKDLLMSLFNTSHLNHHLEFF